MLGKGGGVNFGRNLLVLPFLASFCLTLHSTSQNIACLCPSQTNLRPQIGCWFSFSSPALFLWDQESCEASSKLVKYETAGVCFFPPHIIWSPLDDYCQFRTLSERLMPFSKWAGDVCTWTGSSIVYVRKSKQALFCLGRPFLFLFFLTFSLLLRIKTRICCVFGWFCSGEHDPFAFCFESAQNITEQNHPLQRCA